MLYEEFLAGTGAVDNQTSYEEFVRVEQIYWDTDGMSKEDAYRMAKVETIKQQEAEIAKARKLEKEWVLKNIIPAAAYIRGMSEKAGYFSRNFEYVSPCGNHFELRLVREINCGSVTQYELWINDKRVELEKHCQYGLLPGAEFSTYWADWHDKSLKELEDLFGFIVR